MEKFDYVPRGPHGEMKLKTITDQLDDLKENLAVYPLEKTLKKLNEIFTDTSSDAKQFPLYQSKVAFLLAGLMESWQKSGKKISDLKNETDTFFESQKQLSDLLKYVRPEQLGKRQPTMIESIRETLDRLELMEKLENVFLKPCKGIILGGSLSYGQFYSVRDERNISEGSDIDTIFVLDKSSQDEGWRKFLECPYFSDTDKQNFISRKNIFLKSLYPKGEANILSHKFNPREKNYNISIHFFTDKTLDEMLINNFGEEIKGEDKVVVVKDYRSELFPHAICPQANFDGVPYNYTVPKQKTTDKGIVAELPSYIIKNHKYHPGVYQNLILPMFYVFHDRDGEITDKVHEFKKNMYGYISDNYGRENIETVILKSHIRNTIFPETLKDEIKD